MTIDDIRAELDHTLAELHDATTTMPWPVRRIQAIETMFPDHTARLPDGEGAALVEAFENELAARAARGLDAGVNPASSSDGSAMPTRRSGRTVS